MTTNDSEIHSKFKEGMTIAHEEKTVSTVAEQKRTAVSSLRGLLKNMPDIDKADIKEARISERYE